MADLRDLLKNGINDEALRRMARRAGVQATSQKETDLLCQHPKDTKLNTPDINALRLAAVS